MWTTHWISSSKWCGAGAVSADGGQLQRGNIMLPSLLLISIGSRCRIPIPVPIFLLWPLIVLFALPIGLVWLVLPARIWQGSLFAKGALFLRLLWNLHGLKVDVTSNDGTKVYISVI